MPLEKAFFIEIAPYVGSFIARDEGGAGILTGGKFTDGGDDRVFDEGSCNEVIVFTGFWIVKNGGYLFECQGGDRRRHRRKLHRRVAQGFRV